MIAKTANPFLGQTRRQARPDRDQERFSVYGDAQLREQQTQWDFAENWAKEDDKLRDERLAKQEAEREAARRQGAADDEAAFIAPLRRTYLGADPSASEADFQRDLPEIRRQHRIAAVLTAGVEVEREQAAATRSLYRG